MRIFLSWSGQASRQIAMALKTWLPDVVQHVDAWMSEHDVDAGSRWGHELTNVLGESNFGVICLTPENQQAPWLLFEAGCLAKTTHIARVVPYLFGLSPTDVRYPLAQFQGVGATKPGTLKLLQSVNEAGQLNIPADRLERRFDKWWPDLEKALRQIDAAPRTPVAMRSEREMLEELLGLVRPGIRLTRIPIVDPIDSRSVILDTSNFFEAGPQISMRYEPERTISQFLDRIYFALNDIGKVPAFEYGSVWLLRDKTTGRTYDDIGIEYCRSGGEIKDNRTLESVGIKPGDQLEVIHRGRGQQGNKRMAPRRSGVGKRANH